MDRSSLTYVESKEQLALRRRLLWPHYFRFIRFSLVAGAAILGAAAAFFFWLDSHWNRTVVAALLYTFFVPVVLLASSLSLFIPVRVKFGERAFTKGKVRIPWSKVKRFDFLHDPAMPGYCGAALYGARGILAVAWVPESDGPDIAKFVSGRIGG